MDADFLHNRLNVLESILHGILFTDLRGHIIYLNAACENIFGYTEEEIIGKSIRILYDNENEIPLKEVLTRSTSGDFVMGRWQAKHKDGSRIWLDVRVKVRFHENKNHGFMVVSVCDIEKLKTTESKLKVNKAIAEAILDTSVDTIITINEKVKILSFNRAAINMFGYHENEVPGADEVQEISDMIKNADEYARTLSRGMAQVDLEKKGLGVALQNLCSQTEKLSGISCTYIEAGNVDIDNHSMALHIYRIVQESVNNVIKHADAKNFLSGFQEMCTIFPSRLMRMAEVLNRKQVRIMERESKS